MIFELGPVCGCSVLSVGPCAFVTWARKRLDKLRRQALTDLFRYFYDSNGRIKIKEAQIFQDFPIKSTCQKYEFFR